MIFQHTHELVMAGRKTQTRRVFDAEIDHLGIKFTGMTSLDYVQALYRDGYLKYATGSTYAVQPGRGKRAIGRIRVTGLRVERLQTMTHEDALAEGVASVDEYAALWDAIHAKRGERWDDNPLVVVISFILAPAD